MKVFLHYEDNENTDLHKSLKITLPKSWKNGPTSKLLEQFVESYNANESLGGGPNPLDASQLHLAVRKHQQQQQGATTVDDSHTMVELASDAVIIDCIPDRADVYIMNGPSKTVQEIQQEEREERERKEESLKNMARCTHFGCHNTFPKGGPYPVCHYHKSPPVFHETAKFWSCCPNKKAYDWDSFQNIPGCETGTCTDVKQDEQQKLFLGGCDLREQAGEAIKLKSIDDFNKAQAAGGSDAAPVLERFQNVLDELGVEKELTGQVIDGIKLKMSSSQATLDEAELLELVKAELGSELKESLKAIAAEQLRIK